MSKRPPRKPPKSKKRKKVAINAQSGSTGIIHFFPDAETFEKLADDLEKKATVERTIGLAKSLKFWSWLNDKSINIRPTYTLDHSLFRICFNGFEPLEISGSLASGGRFNMGGAQVHNAFDINMAACIYGANSQKCATDEVGPMVKSPEYYELTPTQPLILWDLLKVITELDPQSVMSVKKMVDDLPMNADWVLQKFPSVSQLLAHRLRAMGGNGLVYPSVKSPDGYVYAIFVKDNADARQKFAFQRI